MFSFRSVPLADVPWEELDRYPDRVIFQTLPWLRFLEKNRQVRPVVVEISRGSTLAGYLTLLAGDKGPLRILGSPFHGWTTGYMGFNLQPGFTRGEILRDLPDYFARDFGWHYFQLCDYHLAPSDLETSGYTVDYYQNFEIDLAKGDERLFGDMNQDCRRRIRKAAQRGVIFEEAAAEGFAEEYYAQLTDVFAKHRLVPTYGIERVRDLLDHLHPTGNLLLLRARNPAGESIATGIYTAFHRLAFAWGFASWRQYQHEFTPNEGLMWHAIQCLKGRGCTWFDIGGWAPYKKKYGTIQVTRPFLMRSKPGFLIPCKALAMKSWYLCHKGTSRLRLLAGKGEGANIGEEEI